MQSRSQLAKKPCNLPTVVVSQRRREFRFERTHSILKIGHVAIIPSFLQCDTTHVTLALHVCAVSPRRFVLWRKLHFGSRDERDAFRCWLASSPVAQFGQEMTATSADERVQNVNIEA
jgi:hypothetical protein